MSNIVDKRFIPKQGSVENRRKFIKRHKKAIKDAVREVVNKGSIKDFKMKDHKIKIKTGTDLPGIDFDRSVGTHKGIATGNKTFRTGDKVDKQNGGGGRPKASDGGEGQDSFEFLLTEKEFADLFFEDLELPELIKKNFLGDIFETQRQGFSNTGGPSSLSIKQTIIRALMRKIALTKKQEKEKDKLIVEDGQVIVKPKKKISFLEEVDLKFIYRDKVPVPASKAVMFCLMDVSGSMGEKEKDIAKRFYILLNMFLKRNYDMVDVVFVRHADWAEECDEKTFFYDRASGGTIISKGYEKIEEIIGARYNPEQWNIYIAQASDGDNFESDNRNLLGSLKNLLKNAQYFAYLEILSPWRDGDSDIYQLLSKLSKQVKNLAIRSVLDYNEIFEVFRSLFAKKRN